MKSRPCKLSSGRYIDCAAQDATHLTINSPGPSGQLTFPVILHGTRKGTNCWTWNGSIDAPTLKPSVLTKGHGFLCHTWINDGKAQFLDDCSHEYKGQTLDLLDVKAEA